MGALSRPLRLAIVNDYAVVVAGLAALLEGHAERLEVIELTTRQPVVSDVDIVLVDTFAFVPGGLLGLPELTRHARATGAKVVVFSWTTSPEAVRRALAQGAVGYLSKRLEKDELVEALEAVHAGQVVTRTGEHERPAVEAAPRNFPGREFDLSPREAEVLALIAKGLSNDEIAGTLFLSINSVKTYIRTAYRKMGVTRRSQAVLWAVANGYVLEARRTVLEPRTIDLQAASDYPLLRPIAQSVEAVSEFGPFTTGDDDLLEQLNRHAERVLAVVPQCVGLSMASIDDGVTFTLVATTDEVAALDAVQYLSGGPCDEAADVDLVLAYDEAALFDEQRWRRFAASTAAANVSSTLSLPILRDGQVIGTINLYASTPDAFDGHHLAVADIFSAWAPGAITNADLSFTTRRLAEQAPQLLRDDLDLQVATRIVAEEKNVDAERARFLLDDAAQRAGVSSARFARQVADVGRLEESD